MFNDPSGLTPEVTGQEWMDRAMSSLDNYNRTQYDGPIAGTGDRLAGRAVSKRLDEEYLLLQGGEPKPGNSPKLVNGVYFIEVKNCSFSFERRGLG